MSSAGGVSVVIPCFNDGEYVGEACASAFSEGAGEVIVVDDGSRDPETRETLDRLAGEGVVVIRQANQGLSGARMTGVRAATLPLVQTLDADDRLGEGCLGPLAEALEGDTSLSAVWGDIQSFGAENCRFRTADVLDPWRITFLSEPQGGVVMARREAILEIGGWSMGSGYEDWDFLMAGAEHGWNARRVDVLSLYYREHEGGRMFRESRERHTELVENLRSRHGALFAARWRNWRRARARWGVKLAWPLIAALPGLSDVTRERMFILSRDTFEPWMAPSTAPSVPRRLVRVISGTLRSRLGS